MEAELDDVWSTVSHLNSVMNTAELHHVYQKMLTHLTEYHTEIKQNEKLYQAYLSIVESPTYSKLNIAQKKVIDEMTSNKSHNLISHLRTRIGRS